MELAKGIRSESLSDLLGVLVNKLQHPPAPLDVGDPGGRLAPPAAEDGGGPVHDDPRPAVDILIIQPGL